MTDPHADAVAARVGLSGGDEPFHYAGKRSAVGRGAGREIAHQLGVQPAGLAAGRVQPPVRGEVGRGGDELLLRRDRRGQVKEKRLSRAVVADDEPDHRAAVRDPVEVAADGGDLVGPAYLDVGEPAPRDDACSQGADDGVAVTRPQPQWRHGRGLGHGSISLTA